MVFFVILSPSNAKDIFKFPCRTSHFHLICLCHNRDGSMRRGRAEHRHRAESMTCSRSLMLRSASRRLKRFSRRALKEQERSRLVKLLSEAGQSLERVSWQKTGSVPQSGIFKKAVSELPEEVSDKLFDETVARIPFVISRRGYRAEAVTFARDLEPRFAKEPMRLGALGEFYLNVEAPGDAIRVLESAVEQRKEEVRLRRPLAAAYRMSLRLDQSAKELEQVTVLDEKDTRAFTELGNIARAKGEYDEALKYYTSQLRIDPTNAAALKGVALTALARGRDSEFDETWRG